MLEIHDPNILVTLRIAMKREIRELKRLIRAAENDGEKPSEFLVEELERAREAHNLLSAA